MNSLKLQLRAVQEELRVKDEWYSKQQSEMLK